MSMMPTFAARRGPSALAPVGTPDSKESAYRAAAVAKGAASAAKGAVNRKNVVRLLGLLVIVFVMYRGWRMLNSGSSLSSSSSSSLSFSQAHGMSDKRLRDSLQGNRDKMSHELSMQLAENDMAKFHGQTDVMKHDKEMALKEYEIGVQGANLARDFRLAKYREDTVREANEQAFSMAMQSERNRSTLERTSVNADATATILAAKSNRDAIRIAGRLKEDEMANNHARDMASIYANKEQFDASVRHDIAARRLTAQAAIEMRRLRNEHLQQETEMRMKIEQARSSANSEAEVAALEAELSKKQAESQARIDLIRAESEIRRDERAQANEEMKRRERVRRKRQCFLDLERMQNVNASCDDDGYMKCVNNFFPAPLCKKKCNEGGMTARFGESLKTVIDNECVCPANYRFLDKITCRAALGNQGSCEYKYKGRKCDEVKFPAVRVDLDGDGVAEPNFEAQCPSECQFQDRDRCESGSKCRDGFHGENCDKCTAYNGSTTHPTYLTPTVGPDGKVTAACPKGYHFLDRKICGPVLVEREKAEPEDADTRIEEVGTSSSSSYDVIASQSTSGSSTGSSSTTIGSSSSTIGSSSSTIGSSSSTIGSSSSTIGSSSSTSGSSSSTSGSSSSTMSRLVKLVSARAFAFGDPYGSYSWSSKSSSLASLPPKKDMVVQNPMDVKCKDGYTHLSESEPYCQTCAPGYLQVDNPDGSISCQCPDPPKYGTGCNSTAECRKSVGMADKPSELVAPGCSRCKNKNKVWSEGKCVCDNPYLVYKETCNTDPLPSANVDNGFMKFEQQTLSFMKTDATDNCLDVAWTGGAQFNGSEDGSVPPCPRPCTWNTKEEAMAAMVHWPEASGFVRTSEGTYKPINNKNVMSQRCRVPTDDNSPFDTVFAKICAHGRDPAEQCRKCTFPYVFDEKNPTCKPDDPKNTCGCICPATHDAKTCGPMDCAEGSGLDPSERCMKCINPRMKFNPVKRVCECDSEQRQFDMNQCGGLLNDQPIKCRAGSGLSPDDECNTCTKPADASNFIRIDSGYRVPDKPGKQENNASNLATCRTMCLRNKKCALFTFSNQSCTLYYDPPIRDPDAAIRATVDRPTPVVIASGEGVPPAGTDALNAAFENSTSAPATSAGLARLAPATSARSATVASEDVAAPASLYLKRKVIGATLEGDVCKCPSDAHALDPITGICECTESPFVDPSKCAKREGGTFSAHTDDNDPIQSFMDNDTGDPTVRCKAKNAHVAEIHDRFDEKAIEDLIQPGIDYFVNARRSPDDAQLRWQQDPKTLVDRPDDEYDPNLVVDDKTSSYVCLVVRKPLDTSKSMELAPSPCSTTEGLVKGYVCQSGSHLKCINHTLDPDTDCSTCKNPNWVPDKNTGLCNRDNMDANPEWGADQKLAPYTAHPKQVSGQLEWMLKKRSTEDAKAFMPQAQHITLKPSQTVEHCANECMRMGRDNEFKCQGFVFSEMPNKLLGTWAPRTCVPFSDRSGLSKDDLVANDQLDTYVMNYCKEPNKQYWSESPCTNYIGSNDVEGNCPKDYKDQVQCMPKSQCATTGMRDATDCREDDNGNITCGDCSPSDCIDGVEDDPEKGRCAKCTISHAKGEFTGNLRECKQCDLEASFKALVEGEGSCQCTNPDRAPGTRCKSCTDNRGGPNCEFHRDTECNTFGIPTDTADANNMSCTCDAETKVNNQTFSLHWDENKLTCDTCELGWGPPAEKDTPYPCTVKVDVCDVTKNTTHHNHRIREMLNNNPSLVKLRKDTSPVETQPQCDCSALNNAIPVDNSQSHIQDGSNRGRWTGRMCDVCPSGFGGIFCNIHRSACHNRGQPAADAEHGGEPRCACEGNFKSGGTCAPSDCKPGWYGANCDVPHNACGIIHGIGTPTPHMTHATPSHPHCNCEAFGMVHNTQYADYHQSGHHNQSWCQCPAGHIIKSGGGCEPLHPCSNASSGHTNYGDCVCNAGWTKASASEDCIHQENMPLRSFTDWNGAADPKNYERDWNVHGGWLPGYGSGEKQAAEACAKRGQNWTYTGGGLFSGGHTVGRNQYTCTTGLSVDNTGNRPATSAFTFDMSDMSDWDFSGWGGM